MGVWISPLSDGTNGWTFNNLLMKRIGTGSNISLFWNNEILTDLFSFSNNKNYLIKSKINSLGTLTSNELTITTIWNTNFNTPTLSAFNGNGFLNFYSKPNSLIQNRTSHFYKASDTFNGNKGISETSVIELSWDIIGFSWISDGTTLYSPTTQGLGWNIIDNTYTWYYHNTPTEFVPGVVINNTYTINSSYRKINCLSTYVSAQRFNLEFEFISNDGDIEIYLSDRPPYNGTDITIFNQYLASSNKILTILSDRPVKLVSLTGGQYVIIVSKPKDENIPSIVNLVNLRLFSDYHPGNNKQYISAINDFDINIPGATFSAIVGDRQGDFLLDDDEIELSLIKSKIGNGFFDAGIWENGVWNSGWRKDEKIIELFDIDYNIKVFSDFKWHVRISGLYDRLINLKKGDLISVGNIVAVDINEERKQLIDAYRIIDIGVSELLNENFQLGYIIIEIETTFPIRRIEKDSEEHRIKITKNIWLSGAFLNGYFSGVWNYGLFRGFPLITEMFNTHWKDGFFEGGHFTSRYISKENVFINTLFEDTKLGIVCLNPHNLKVGDVIEINKDDKSINNVYDTKTKVIFIIDKLRFITDIDFNVKVNNESGVYITYVTDSVIQNVNFKSENVSRITSNVSLNSTTVFNYNSWIDVNYDNNVAVNIGKDQNLLDDISRRSYAENNLYGYQTKDVLSSISKFRNSFSLEDKSYKLGTKYKVYKNYIGDASLFNEYFDTDNDINNFILQGWTFSVATSSTVSYKRTLDEGIPNIVGQELEIKATNMGGVLDIINEANVTIDNRQKVPIEKNRYSKIKFELIENNNQSNIFIDTINNIEIPILHFNNINSITRNGEKLINTSLPISKNVNILETNSLSKVEYFYNKKHLSLVFKGNSNLGQNESSVVIKKLNFLEIDMVPFFKYFTDDTINKSIQIPYQGIAPFIDYNNINFIFLDNINIGLDSVKLTNTFEVFTGTGTGVGSITPITPVVTLPPRLPSRPTPTPLPIPLLTVSSFYNGDNIIVSASLTSILQTNIEITVTVTYETGIDIIQNVASSIITITQNNIYGSNTIFTIDDVQSLTSCVESIDPPNLVNISQITFCSSI